MALRSFKRSLSGPWNLIGGQRTSPECITDFLNVTEPATGKILCKVPCSNETDVNKAVSCAKQAFKSWSELSPRERGHYLLKAGGLIRENLEEIAQLEVKDVGKPIWEARCDITSCADSLEYFGGIAPTLVGQHIPLPGKAFAIVTREPYGVVAGIGAWNFPLQTCVWKVAPALASGNTIVYKPSQYTPVTAPILGEIFASVGVPDGVYNVIQGGAKTGTLLCNHPEVEKLSFTGSLLTGTKVMGAAATGIKAVTLELGGKSPLIVFEDADIINAVKGVLMANFLSQGEVCSNGTRVYVHSKVIKEFTKILVEKTKKLKIGNPLSDDTTVGATIHEEHAIKVLSYIESAKNEGAVVLCGGERVSLPGELANGWYLSPCILTEVNHGMKVVKEEVFGAVLALIEFNSEEEVVNMANDTPFGLAGAVFTKDLQRGHRVAKNIDAGIVWINTFNLTPPEVPFGGFKRSGFGRENGTWALDFYTQPKTIYVEMGDVDCGPLF